MHQIPFDLLGSQRFIAGREPRLLLGGRKVLPGLIDEFIFNRAHMIPDVRAQIIQVSHQFLDGNTQLFAKFVNSHLIYGSSPPLINNEPNAFANSADVTPKMPRPGRPVQWPNSSRLP